MIARLPNLKYIPQMQPGNHFLGGELGLQISLHTLDRFMQQETIAVERHKVTKLDIG